MSGVTYAMLVVFEADAGTERWTPVHRDNLPAAIKDPEVMARLADGDECELDGKVYRATYEKNMGLLLAH